MGSDKYLRVSMFFSGVSSPRPAVSDYDVSSHFTSENTSSSARTYSQPNTNSPFYNIGLKNEKKGWICYCGKDNQITLGRTIQIKKNWFRM